MVKPHQIFRFAPIYRGCLIPPSHSPFSTHKASDPRGNKDPTGFRFRGGDYFMGHRRHFKVPSHSQKILEIVFFCIPPAITFLFPLLSKEDKYDYLPFPTNGNRKDKFRGQILGLYNRHKSCFSMDKIKTFSPYAFLLFYGSKHAFYNPPSGYFYFHFIGLNRHSIFPSLFQTGLPFSIFHGFGL